MREMIKKLKKNNNEKKWEKEMEEKNQMRLKKRKSNWRSDKKIKLVKKDNFELSKNKCITNENIWLEWCYISYHEISINCTKRL